MNWENGQAALKEERREQRREEMQNIRSRLFMVSSEFMDVFFLQ